MSKHTTTATTTTTSAWWLLTVFVLLTFLANFSPILALPTSTTSSPSLRLDKRQAPNQMYIYSPTLQTASLNMTTFIFPIPLSEAYSLASPYNLLLNHNLPSSVIPSGYFPFGGDTLSFAAAQGLINTVDGPGLVSPLIQSVFSRTTSSPISEATFKSMLDQPYYTSAGAGCNYVDLYYNFTNANPSFVSGNVQAFSPLIDADTNYATAVGYTAAT
ncbi:hypothetical protein NDA16_000269 [Ustilago loliicola]|nr:hypothetical protein NDA16_000269 [Ustilago loliicola]